MLRSFGDSTLIGNWYESRIGQPEELSYAEKTAARGRRPSEPHLQVYPEVTGDTSRPVQGPRLRRFAEPNTWRTQTVDVAQSAAEPHVAAPTIAQCRTAKQDMDAHLHEKVAPRPAPKLINHLNLREALQADRVSMSTKPATGFGATLPSHGPEEGQRQLVTTSQDTYTIQPAAARMAHPDAYGTTRTPQSSGKLYRDAHTCERTCDTFAGRSGYRGELVRRPAEAGSVYGVSTFVDDYSSWGRKLQGQRLADTVAKRCTRHFDA